MWKSSMMRLLHDNDECPVCLFLKGDRSPEIMLLVIERLDGKLAESDRKVKVLTDLVIAKDR